MRIRLEKAEFFIGRPANKHTPEKAYKGSWTEELENTLMRNWSDMVRNCPDCRKNKEILSRVRELLFPEKEKASSHRHTTPESRWGQTPPGV